MKQKCEVNCDKMKQKCIDCSKSKIEGGRRKRRKERKLKEERKEERNERKLKEERKERKLKEGIKP